MKILYNPGSAEKTIEIKGKTEGPYNSTSCDRVVGPYQFPGADAADRNSQENWQIVAASSDRDGVFGQAPRLREEDRGGPRDAQIPS